MTWTCDDLRPLGEISLIRDPSLFISADCVIDIWTPGHVGKHIKQVCKLLWWQGTVLVLKHTNGGLFVCLGSSLELLWFSRIYSTTIPSVHIRSWDSFHRDAKTLLAQAATYTLTFFLISWLNLLSIPQDVKPTQQVISADLCNVCSFELLWGSSRWTGFYLVMFVKDALEKEVGIVVELRGGAWRNLQPTHKDVLYSRYPSTWAWKGHHARRLTGERGSPGLTPGHRHNQTSSAPSRWFHGALAGWTRCGGRGSLHKDITNTQQSCFCTHTLATLHLRTGPVVTLLPLSVSPLLHTPSLRFFRTTFFTSSNARGSSGVLKHVLWEEPDKLSPLQRWPRKPRVRR